MYYIFIGIITIVIDETGRYFKYDNLNKKLYKLRKRCNKESEELEIVKLG